MEFNHNNIFPNNITRTLFHRLDPIQHNIRKIANNICRNQLNELYINQCFKKFKYGYYYKDSNDKIIGFCIWKVNIIIPKGKNEYPTYKSMKLYLLCAEKFEFNLGKVILYDLETLCIKDSIHEIRLDAANQKLISYYQSYGYLLTNPNKYEMYKHIDVLPLNTTGTPGKSRKRRSIRNNRRNQTEKIQRIYKHIDNETIPHGEIDYNTFQSEIIP